MIQCKDINLSFSGKIIFDNLNISIASGENVCISGPSGIGKSTLLKLIQGYVIPDEGSIQINDQELSAATIKEIRGSIVWIPQNVNLPVNNGGDLIKLMNLQSKEDIINSTGEKLGLEKDIIFKDFGLISGGQKQRIIISICLSLDKKIILMDEPTSSLDDASINLLIKLVKSLKGKTIISASHNNLWLTNVDKTIAL